MKKAPFIENIIIIGLPKSELKTIQDKNFIAQRDFHNISGTILENYQSKYLSQSLDKTFLSHIPHYAFPKGIIDISQKNKKSKILTSFSLKSRSFLKHITCLSIAGAVKNKQGELITVKTGILLVSSIDIYECQKEILIFLYQIIANFFCNESNSNIYCVFDRANRQIEENRILNFYFDFFLNTPIDLEYNSSFCLCSLNNNYNKKIICKFHIDFIDNIKEILPLKEYDISFLLEAFHIEDLIQIYISMLLELKIIFIFDNYSEINLIIQSLLALLYPLNSKKYQIISFINQSNYNMINLPISIIGVHYSMEELIPESDDVIIYSLITKKFKFCPQSYLSYKNKARSQAASSLNYLYGEKLSINIDMDFDESELSLMFNETACVKMNSVLYFNLKMLSIFFEFFLNLINGLNKYCVFNYEKSRDNILEKVFDAKGFCGYDLFKTKLIKTSMFTNFIIKYTKYNTQKPKYIFIHKMLTEQEKNSNYKKYSKEIFTEQIKNRIISYYQFSYLNLSIPFENYIIKNGRDIFTPKQKVYSLTHLLHFSLSNEDSNNYCLIEDKVRLSKYELFNIHTSLPQLNYDYPKEKNCRSSSLQKKQNSPSKTYYKIYQNTKNYISSSSNRSSLSTVNNLRRGNPYLRLDNNYFKNETTGEIIKNKLSSEYIPTNGNNANKNLLGLVNSLNNISPKHSKEQFIGKSIKNFEMPLQLSVMTNKDDFKSIKVKDLNIVQINNKELPMLDGDDDVDIFSCDDNE